MTDIFLNLRAILFFQGGLYLDFQEMGELVEIEVHWDGKMCACFSD